MNETLEKNTLFLCKSVYSVFLFLFFLICNPLAELKFFHPKRVSSCFWALTKPRSEYSFAHAISKLDSWKYLLWENKGEIRIHSGWFVSLQASVDAGIPGAAALLDTLEKVRFKSPQRIESAIKSWAETFSSWKIMFQTEWIEAIKKTNIRYQGPIVSINGYANEQADIS